MQVSDETAATQVANPAKRLLAEAGIGNMTEEQQNAFFKQMQLAMGGAAFRQPSGDIESQGTNRMWPSPIFTGRPGLTLMNQFGSNSNFSTFWNYSSGLPPPPVSRVFARTETAATTPTFDNRTPMSNNSGTLQRSTTTTTDGHRGFAGLSNNCRSGCSRIWYWSWYDKFLWYSNVLSQSNQILGSQAQEG